VKRQVAWQCVFLPVFGRVKRRVLRETRTHRQSVCKVEGSEAVVQAGKREVYGGSAAAGAMKWHALVGEPCAGLGTGGSAACAVWCRGNGGAGEGAGGAQANSLP